MKAYLVRVGIDQAFGKWNAPIDPETGAFVYVPIPEKAGTTFQPGMVTDYTPFRSALEAFARASPSARASICTPPVALNDLNPHLDPDFDRLTYGDNGLRRGKGLCDLGAGDLVVFFAGMRPIKQSPHKLIYGIIGLYRVAEAVRLRDIPASRWADNAHTRKLRHGPDDIIIRAQPGVSGRLRRSIPIGEFRDKAYRVRRDLLSAWGDLTCRNGFIQRSAVPPAFRDPARFLAWFESHSPILMAANNPGVGPASSVTPPPAPRPATSLGAGSQAEASPRIVLVHLRQPNRSKPTEARTDPLYEYGSFGTTGCHRTNLLHDVGATGARLGFIQPGRNAMRLVFLTPPVKVINHGKRREASWSPADMPLRYLEGVLLIDNDGNTDVPGLKAILARGQRSTWVGRFSSAFRSRTKPLPPDVAAMLEAAWNQRVEEAGPTARAEKYWQALPFMPPMPDTDRAATRARLLAEARGETVPATKGDVRVLAPTSRSNCAPRRSRGPAEVALAEMHLLVRGWIVDILKRNESVVAVALRQRAKFEGWLKLELAAHAGRAGATAVQVETAAPGERASHRGRSDLSFVFDVVRYDLELKTPNGNWRLPGVDTCTRPITKNIADIVNDGRKLAGYSDHGLVAFVLFPLPVGDARWQTYLERIARELATPLDTLSHTTQVTLPVSASHAADLVVCCFPIQRAHPAPPSALPSGLRALP